MPYIIGYYFICLFLLVPIAICSYIVGLVLLCSSNQETQESSLTALFRIPFLLWGLIWGAIASTNLVKVIEYFPLLVALAVFAGLLLPLIGLAIAALIAENICERAEDKIANDRNIYSEMIRAFVIWGISILILIAFSFIPSPTP